MYDLTNQGVKLFNMPVIKNDLNAPEAVRIHHYICNQPLTATMTRVLVQDQTFTPLTSSEGINDWPNTQSHTQKYNVHWLFPNWKHLFSLLGSIFIPFAKTDSITFIR